MRWPSCGAACPSFVLPRHPPRSHRGAPHRGCPEGRRFPYPEHRMNRLSRRTRLLVLGILVALEVAGLVALQSDVAKSRQDGPALLVQPEASVPVPRLSLPLPDEQVADGWADLVDRPWRHATTGWQVLADFDEPEHDSSFVYGPMAIAGQIFERGISTYPFSEITYDLDGHGLRFSAQVGITDDSKDGAGSARFLVYGDEFLLYESGEVRAGEPAREIDLSVEGLGEL